MSRGPVYASVDLGGTKIACVLAREDGQPLAEGTIPTLSYEGPDGVLARIAELIESLARTAGERPAAVGMGVPGSVELRTGTTKFLPNLRTGWRDVPVGARLGARLGCPVYLINDVRLATLGELVYGHGRAVRNFVLYAIGTGVGGGVVVDGRLVLGRGPFAGAVGEMGHQSVEPHGPSCSCGNRGCLELFISGPALVGEAVRLLLSGNAPGLNELVGGDVGKVDVRGLANAAERGDARAREAIVRAATYLGIGVANTVTTLAPEMVVLAGGVAGIGALLFDTVRAVVRERVGLVPTEPLRIEPSLLADRAGALGGIALAAQRGLLHQLD